MLNLKAHCQVCSVPQPLESNQIQMAFVELTQWHNFFFLVRKFKCNENYSETMSLENSMNICAMHAMCVRVRMRWNGSASNYLEQYKWDDMSAKFKVKCCHRTAEKMYPYYVDSKALFSNSKVSILENYWHQMMLDASPSSCFFFSKLISRSVNKVYSTWGLKKRSNNNNSTACSSSPYFCQLHPVALLIASLHCGLCNENRL